MLFAYSIPIKKKNFLPFLTSHDENSRCRICAQFIGKARLLLASHNEMEKKHRIFENLVSLIAHVFFFYFYFLFSYATLRKSPC